MILGVRGVEFEVIKNPGGKNKARVLSRGSEFKMEDVISEVERDFDVEVIN